MSADPPKAPTPSPYYRKSTDSSYRNLLASVAAPDTDDASGQSASQLLSSTMMLPPAPRRLATTTTEPRETFVRRSPPAKRQKPFTEVLSPMLKKLAKTASRIVKRKKTASPKFCRCARVIGESSISTTVKLGSVKRTLSLDSSGFSTHRGDRLGYPQRSELFSPSQARPQSFYDAARHFPIGLSARLNHGATTSSAESGLLTTRRACPTPMPVTPGQASSSSSIPSSSSVGASSFSSSSSGSSQPVPAVTAAAAAPLYGVDPMHYVGLPQATSIPAGYTSTLNYQARFQMMLDELRIRQQLQQQAFQARREA
ncbi:unnamed protein product [Oikopleura dioica]|uniref:Uncharacterized protein n=1 Tax=Oikopleura dioica TaxID=34765 RepID=E4YA66_OIKDI|nr:unnamed protein product [Oikopleura dioica]